MKRMGMAVAALAPMLAFGGMFSGRSGEIFQTTREGPGAASLGLIYIGVMAPPIGILTVPAGIAVGLVDELVVSPAVDLVCLPYDLLQPHHGFVVRISDADGRPVVVNERSAKWKYWESYLEFWRLCSSLPRQ